MEVAPAARRTGVLINPRNPSEQDYPARLNAALSASGVTLIPLESLGLADIDAALAKASAERIGALLVADDAHLAGEAGVRQHILKFTAVAGIAVASSNQNFARDGALLAMGPSVPVLAAAAGYVDKNLKGAKPADLPVSTRRSSARAASPRT
jgi:putative ABC transport system substrate-binding protein